MSLLNSTKDIIKLLMSSSKNQIIQLLMKSKQSLFQQIIATSIRKVKEKSIAGAKDEFELRMRDLPLKIKSLDADPYMFIFDALIAFPDEVDFVLTQYKTMLSQNFLSMDRNSEMICRHFRNNLNLHAFKITQIIIDIRDPNIDFMTLFFDIHNSTSFYNIGIAMAENVLEAFKYTGYKWLARVYSFKQYPKPSFLVDLTAGILKAEDRNLPTLQDENRSRQKYIQKMLDNIVLNVDNSLKLESERVQSKYGFCLMCKKPADYYCKDTGVPVCGSDCKKSHINYIDNNPAINFQYGKDFGIKVEKLLMSNLKNKRNVSLSIDYLSAIYMNSDFRPFEPLPHKQLLSSPVIVERVWVLYSMYYIRKQEVFEHIFASCLNSKTEYISINSAKYFLKIAEHPRILHVYKFLDFSGFKRIIPTVLLTLQDQDKLKFIHSLINSIYSSQNQPGLASMSAQIESMAAKQSSLLRSLNYEKNPLKDFTVQYGEGKAVQQMVRFMIKNEKQINKTKTCELLLSNDVVLRAFLEELLLQKEVDSTLQNDGQKVSISLKSNIFIDQILREVFYFINIKVADKIYHLLSILCQVLDPNKLQPSHQTAWNMYEPHSVFDSESVSSENTMFQFAYLIILIVTQLNKPQNKEKPTETSFLKRVSDIDKKFAVVQKQYCIKVFHRLGDQPFSQQTRGVLTKYQSVKANCQNHFTFYPQQIILDNWELIYEAMVNSNNDTSILYRICSSLIKFPTKCQPFLQLLLNKLTKQQSAFETSENQSEQHLLPCINSIIQQQPNCIGTASWKYLFMKDPKPASASHLYLFEISILIQYSKYLTLANFIWFVRQFCRNVSLSNSYQDCLKLLSYNFSLCNWVSKTIEKGEKQNRDRVQILNKQFIQLFINQTNVYFQIEFLKGVFNIKNFDLGINLLDILEVNIVSQSLILVAIIDIVQSNWKEIENYGQSTVKNESEELNNKIWTHIINKVLFIGASSPDLLLQFSRILYSIPELHPYFEYLNIQHAISSIFEGIQCQIDPRLRNKMAKFQKYIHQMHEIQGEHKFTLLQQFVLPQNVDSILRHFNYFWQIQQVYPTLQQVIDLGQISPENFKDILELLKTKMYNAVIMEENRLQSVLGYLVRSYIYLSKEGIDGQLSLAESYKIEIQKFVDQVLLLKIQSAFQGDVSEFICVSNLLHFYLDAWKVLLINKHKSQFQVYKIDHLCNAIQKLNSNFQLRKKFKFQLCEISNLTQSFKLAPEVFRQQSLSLLLSYFHGHFSLAEDTVSNPLLNYLSNNVSNFQRILFLLNSQPKIKLNKGQNEKKNKAGQDQRLKQKPSQNVSQNDAGSANSFTYIQKKNQIQEVTELQFLNEKIFNIKKILKAFVNILSSKAQSMQKENQELNAILVEYLELGFDFYNPYSQKIEFTTHSSKDHGFANLISTLYRLLNSQIFKVQLDNQ